MANALDSQKQASVMAGLAWGLSIRALERFTGVHRDTIMRMRRQYRAAISPLPARQEYLAKCAALSSERRAARVRALEEPLLVWPYLRSFDNEDYRLMERVNLLVPRTFPESVRADMCQELLVDIISGDLEIDNAQSRIAEYARRAFKFEPSKFGPLSLDALMFGDGDRTLLDTLKA